MPCGTSSPPLPTPTGIDPDIARGRDRAAVAFPGRVEEVLRDGAHRDLGRLVRDAVLLARTVPSSAAAPGTGSAAVRALEVLSRLHHPSGTFRGGDNLDSPPDTAFTVNDLAWSLRALDGIEAPWTGEVRERIAGVLGTVAPALLRGGVHTPNHRWELASALARIGETTGHPGVRARAEQWLAEGVDLQADGQFSERSPNYVAHVSVPSLLALARILDRPDLRDAADRALGVSARLTGRDGFLETISSRRQDQKAPFPGEAMHPLFRAHAARTGDPVTARAARRTAARLRPEDALAYLALVVEDPASGGPLPAAAADPTPAAPEVLELGDSGLVRVDHGTSVTVLFGGTDTARQERIASGLSNASTFARFGGRTVRAAHLRLSRRVFSLGPLRPGPPERVLSSVTTGGSADTAIEHVLAEDLQVPYFQPMEESARDPQGRYRLGFNGRFSAAMDFPGRARDIIGLRTEVRSRVRADRLELTLTTTGPEVPQCLLLGLEGGTFADGATVRDDRGRHVLRPTGADGSSRADCRYVGEDEELRITVEGELTGPAFYEPGEAFAFLGATDEPEGDVLLVPVASSAPVRLTLALDRGTTRAG